MLGRMGDPYELLEMALFKQDEFILREAIDRRPKKKLYKEMNMTYFMDRERNGRYCMSVLFEARNSSIMKW